jgi:excisionase family DNA binding protein
MSALTLTEVAAELQLPSTESVRRLIRDGRLPAYRVGQYWRVDEDELAVWKAAGGTQARRTPTDSNRLEPRSPRGQAQVGKTRTNTSRARGR